MMSEELGNMKYADLQKECSARGLPAKGKAEELRKRLQDLLQSDDAQSRPAPGMRATAPPVTPTRFPRAAHNVLTPEPTSVTDSAKRRTQEVARSMIDKANASPMPDIKSLLPSFATHEGASTSTQQVHAALPPAYMLGHDDPAVPTHPPAVPAAYPPSVPVYTPSVPAAYHAPLPTHSQSVPAHQPSGPAYSPPAPQHYTPSPAYGYQASDGAASGVGGAQAPAPPTPPSAASSAWAGLKFLTIFLLLSCLLGSLTSLALRLDYGRVQAGFKTGSPLTALAYQVQDLLSEDAASAREGVQWLQGRAADAPAHAAHLLAHGRDSAVCRSRAGAAAVASAGWTAGSATRAAAEHFVFAVQHKYAVGLHSAQGLLQGGIRSARQALHASGLAPCQPPSTGLDLPLETLAAVFDAPPPAEALVALHVDAARTPRPQARAVLVPYLDADGAGDEAAASRLLDRLGCNAGAGLHCLLVDGKALAVHGADAGGRLQAKLAAHLQRHPDTVIGLSNVQALPPSALRLLVHVMGEYGVLNEPECTVKCTGAVILVLQRDSEDPHATFLDAVAFAMGAGSADSTPASLHRRLAPGYLHFATPSAKALGMVPLARCPLELPAGAVAPPGCPARAPPAPDVRSRIVADAAVAQGVAARDGVVDVDVLEVMAEAAHEIEADAVHIGEL